MAPHLSNESSVASVREQRELGAQAERFENGKSQTATDDKRDDQRNEVERFVIQKARRVRKALLDLETAEAMDIGEARRLQLVESERKNLKHAIDNLFRVSSELAEVLHSRGIAT